MLGPPLALTTTPLLEGGRHGGAQHAAGQHQGIGVGSEGHDVHVDALQAGGGSLEVAVVDGQHHGAAALGPEDAGQAVLHAPVERGASP